MADEFIFLLELLLMLLGTYSALVTILLRNLKKEYVRDLGEIMIVASRADERASLFAWEVLRLRLTTDRLRKELVDELMRKHEIRKSVGRQ